jgi:hypothetical protein
MSPAGALPTRTAIRVLRWLPMIAGLATLDLVGGVKGLLIGVVVAIDVAAISVMAHRALTRAADQLAPDPSWLEAILVWANATVLLTVQVALGGPGGGAGRIAAVVSGLVLGAFATELMTARRPTQAWTKG